MLLGGSGGTFANGTPIAAPPHDGTGQSLAIDDFNHDGDTDIVFTVSSSSAGVWVAVGGAGASFGPPLALGPVPFPSGCRHCRL